MKRFSAQEAEMSLIGIRTFESARRKFFMNTTYIMSRKYETNITAIRTLESARRKFLMNSKYIISRK